MKQKILSLLFMAFFPMAMMAYDAEVDGIYYNVVKKAGIATVTSGDNPYTGNVVIPETFVFEGKAYTVKSIDEGAFEGCSSLTSVDIPSSVTSIGAGSFFRCTSLTSVTIPEGVTSIPDNAFRNCSRLTSVTIPESVTSIGEYAFGACGLTSVTIPESVTSIGEYAFDSSSLNSVTIPSSVKNISNFAFEYCRRLTSVTISEGVERIGERAFYKCDKLESVTIPSSVTSIVGYAFQMCTNLTSVIIQEGVTNISENAFHSCSNLTNVIIPSSVTYMNDHVFFLCSSLETINVCVADYASFCSSQIIVSIPVRLIDNNGNEIKECVIPSNVTSIGDYAFYNCTGLTSVTIPESVESIGSYAFKSCSGMTRVNIPSSVTTIGDEAFANCENLDVVTCYATTVPSTNTNAFDGSYVEYSTLSIPDAALSDYQTTAPWSNFGTILRSSQAIVTANSYIREYGDANPIFEYTSIGILEGEPVITCTADEASAPGVYDIVIAQGTLMNDDVTYVNGTLTIKPAPLTIRAKSYVVNQGDPLPTEYEIEYEGFKNGETEANLDDLPIASSSVTNSDTPGTYDITVSGASSGNYDITFEDGRLLILTYMVWGREMPWTMKYVLQPQDTGIAPATDSSGNAWYDIAFDDSDWDNLTGPVDRLVDEGDWSWDHFGLGEGNYYNMQYENSCLYLRRTFTLSPSAYESMPDWVVLTMEADDVADFYLNGQLVGSNRDKASWYSFGINKSAFVAGDNLLAIYYHDDSGEAYLDYELRAPDSENHVSYTDTQGIRYELNDDQTAWSVAELYWDESKTDIEISSSLFDLPVTKINGWTFNGFDYLTSISLPSTITAIGDYVFSYLSLENLVCNAETPPSCGSLTFEDFDVSNTVLIVPSSSIDAYTTTEPWSYFGTITSLSTTVTANSYTREYGDPNPEYEWTVSGVALDGTPSIACDADESSSPGDYVIEIAQGTVTNDDVTYVNGTLTITKAPLTITAKSYTINDGDDMPAFEVEYDGFKNDETESDLDLTAFTISCTASDTNTPGTYDILVSGAVSDNYDISYVAGTLSVVATTATITISSAGVGTFAFPYDLNFTNVTGMKAYIASGFKPSTGKLVLTQAEEVPAGTGLYVKGTPGTYTIPIEETDMVYMNFLVGVTEATEVSPATATHTNFILSNGSHGIGFYTLSKTGTIAASKAYLSIPTSSVPAAANFVGLEFEDEEATGISEEVIVNNEQSAGDWYTLDGRKLDKKPTLKGVYIMNGKKQVVR